MDLQLAGHVAIVTGASTGIGRATAIALAAEGVTVVGASRHAPSEAVVGVSHVATDLAEADAPARLVELVVKAHGRLDVVVNNAATGRLAEDPLEDDETWLATLNLNLLAAVRMTRASIPHLLGRGGAIVNVTSVNGRVPSPQAAAYSASKAALLNYGKAVASHYVKQGVRVVTVSPGLTATPMWLGPDGVANQLSALGLGEPDDVAAATAASTPLERFLTPEEIASCICFVASPRASAMTGTELIVDGGVTDTM